MERYLESSQVSDTINTDQFGELEIVGTLMQFRDSQASYWSQIGPGGSIIAKPILYNNAVYIGSCDKNFYCLSLEGKEIWKFETNGQLQEGCAGGDGKVFFGSKDGNVYALDAATGREVWTFKTKSEITEMPTFHEGRVYVGSNDRNLYCLDAATGKEIWRFQVKEHDATSPLIINKRIYFGYQDNTFYCINMDGKLIWSYKTPNMVAAWPAAYHEGKVYFGNIDHNIYCLDAVTGKKIWTVAAQGMTLAPTTWKDNLYFGSYDKNVYCVNANTGHLIWKFKTNGPLAGWFEVHDGVAYVGSHDHTVYALDARTGREFWHYRTKGILFSVRMLGGRVYAPSWDCNLYCLSREGKLIWKFRTSMGSPSKIEPLQESSQVTAEFIIPEESQEEKERYTMQTLGAGPESSYIIKSEYVVKSKYTKKRKIQSMSSGWED